MDGQPFTIEEATISEIQQAFTENKLTSRQLVDFYLTRIAALNPVLRAVVEVNPDARDLADEADRERASNRLQLGELHGIPVLLKDTISTKDKLNTTAGSHALVGSVVGRDAGVVERLRTAGAVVLGKASMSEWYRIRSIDHVPNGWCARTGQGVMADYLSYTCIEGDATGALGAAADPKLGKGKIICAITWAVPRVNDLEEFAEVSQHQTSQPLVICEHHANAEITNPYVASESPCGSSSGSAISVAANMVAVSLGTETHSSIICPSDHNSVVGLKPTVGLTSRAGVIPCAPRWDTIGPIGRTVADAVCVLDVIAGFDSRDDDATKDVCKFIPDGGYKQFLNQEGLKGKKLGVVRSPFVDHLHDALIAKTFEDHLNTLRERGAVVVDNLHIANIDKILNPAHSGEIMVMVTDFKTSINAYLKELINSPVRSLSDIIAFNENNPELEKLAEYGQQTFIEAEGTSGIGEKEKAALQMMEKFSKEGFEKIMKENELDAMVTPGSRVSPIYAIGGYPAITVPAGYGSDGMPFGICFGGLRGTEPKLIEIAYGFEKATNVRRPPFSMLSEFVEKASL